MKIVQKGNKQLRIADDQLENYQAKGFCEVDQKTGKLIQKEPADETKALRKENAVLRKENKELKEQLAKLSQQ